MNSIKVRGANYDTVIYKVDMEYICSKKGLDHCIMLCIWRCTLHKKIEHSHSQLKGVEPLNLNFPPLHIAQFLGFGNAIDHMGDNEEPISLMENIHDMEA